VRFEFAEGNLDKHLLEVLLTGKLGVAQPKPRGGADCFYIFNVILAPGPSDTTQTKIIAEVTINSVPCCRFDRLVLGVYPNFPHDV
jgi:hypothetical protein